MITAQQADELSTPKKDVIENDLDNDIRAAIRDGHRSCRTQLNTTETAIAIELLRQNGFYYSTSPSTSGVVTILIKW